MKKDRKRDKIENRSMGSYEGSKNGQMLKTGNGIRIRIKNHREIKPDAPVI